MLLFISTEKVIQDIQRDFSAWYPFLKLDFYKAAAGKVVAASRKQLARSASLREAGLKSEGIIELRHEMTVAELEALFRQTYGLAAQVSRQSGILWLPATITDSWSLQKQNDHGREISEGS